ncbi:MAG: zf-TFIIB domain-containing protein [Proteobacteria bacterium]|nr:hypothetical protein [Pseudomonadota bacterium]NOG60355.1 zf-TFIIB domain-containing protein [Pseudomonadota bacterium]
MDCPVCKGYKLQPAKLDHGLPARTCIKCEGTLIDLLNYRTWLETAPDLAELDEEASLSIQENDKALVCKIFRPFITLYISIRYSASYLAKCTTMHHFA